MNKMDKLLHLGDRYIEESDWKDISLLKICLCAMGVLIGISIPARKKKPAAWIAGFSFFATYLALMSKFVRCLACPDCQKAKKP